MYKAWSVEACEWKNIQRHQVGSQSVKLGVSSLLRNSCGCSVHSSLDIIFVNASV